MRCHLYGCVVVCAFAGCHKAPGPVEDVAQHPLLQRPPAAAEVSLKPPLPKPARAVLDAPEPAAPKRALSMEEAVALACDPRVSDAKRQAGYQAVHRLPPAVRIAGLRTIAAQAPTKEMAAAAAGHLIRAGAPDAAVVACRRWPDWSVREQLIVLAAVREVTLRLDTLGRAPREVPRLALGILLQDGRPRERSADEETVEAGLVDACAMILGPGATTADRALLQKAAERPYASASLWLVLAQLKAVTEKEEGIARKIVRDDTRPVAMRVAAATAIAGRDAKAAAFAEKEIRAFLTRYGSRFSEAEVKSLRTRVGAPGGEQSLQTFTQEFAQFRRDEGLVTVLRFLDTPAAEALAYAAWQCDNLYISQTAAAIVACRWPATFLQRGPGALPRQAYANLLALIAVKNPALGEEVLQRITQRELEEAWSRLRQGSSARDGGPTTNQLIFLFF